MNVLKEEKFVYEPSEDILYETETGKVIDSYYTGKFRIVLDGYYKTEYIQLEKIRTKDGLVYYEDYRAEIVGFQFLNDYLRVK
jgi:hypothetical protein